ncbi:single-strand DNA endonuclease 1 isoform X2 [Prosopis cineraria]|uniref:single-strand DNA endonuclease 1 isoform X2 n=1 Tax=Prosopis cineraria TaxID=364024 RepID=UPI00240EE76B|nr:single-strand DNA endonuclease 1 isoform X2 [Prosopis cineraria]
MHRSLMLDSSTSECGQIHIVCEGESLPHGSLSPHQSAHCFELQPNFCHSVSFTGRSALSECCWFDSIRPYPFTYCALCYFLDGSIPAIKLSTYRQRLNSGKDVAQNESNLQKVSSLPRNRGSEFSCMIKEAHILGMALGIPCLNGIEEGEAQCALLNSELLCDGCFSSDSDIFLFGARTVYRDICLDGGYVVCYEMEDIERKLGFGRDSLIALALLLGSDYSQGVYGLGPELACQIVRSIGDKCVLQKFASEGIECLKTLKGAKKMGQVFKNNKENMLDHDMALSHGGKNNSQRDYNFLQVINAYVKPKCHPADSDIVMRVLAQYPFQRSKLQQICAEFFQWPPEKTDEYILPKIAERDLRRFANLRLTSSQVGVNLPLNEIPVKCPVSEIIKCRKVQGRECYEVSWNEMDGLGTSIVPADLLKSACPEKILEFEEKKCWLKKQNIQKRRPKKSETASSMIELDLRLTNLSLDVNLVDHASHKTSDSSEQVFHDASAMEEADLNSRNLSYSSHDEQIEWDQNVRDTYGNQQQGDSMAKYEVIDLLSPSPPKQSCASSRCAQSNGEHIEVINLSDSDSDTSPEHKRKAKELRLFLAGIRDDLH